MEDLIGLLIQLIVGLFTGKANPPGRLGGPMAPLPPRPPAAAKRPQEIRQRMQGGPSRPPRVPQPAVVFKKMAPPAASKAAAKVVAAQPAAPDPAMAPSIAPTVKHAAAVGVDAAALRKWLKPKTLHSQFVLSEIFQPPVTMRPEREI